MKVAEFFEHWEQVRADLHATLRKFKPEELTFRPFPGSWPVGTIMLHIAETEDYWLHELVTGELEDGSANYPLARYPTLEDIEGVLRRARQRTVALLARLTEEDLQRVYTTASGKNFSLYWILWHVLEHETHHRGELSLTHGLLGREGLDV